ncbi:GNAT family N-acetyltransferase [Sphingomonas sp. LHG3443-2]|uniref:GNAT family N-acetyltransferase n=1 Tax=Sphingomonas sp. LHG3443-2 TaxID=2804639 RepID=UPI003CE92CCF
MIRVRRAEEADHPAWAALLAKLHDDTSAADFEAEIARWVRLPEPYVAFLAEDQAGIAVGLIDARVRNYAEGAPQLRAAYVEDLWVDPDHRGAGVARLLLGAVENWARGESLDWLGSDTWPHNAASIAWHGANGFAEVERLIVFGKPL